jgi:hypothetical protein
VPSDERLEGIMALVALRAQIRDLRHAVKRVTWLVVLAILGGAIASGVLGVLVLHGRG